MVVVRLSRRGSKGNPKYRVTVADRRFSPTGRHIEVIGHYDPLSKEKNFSVDKERYEAWIKKGAQASRTVASLYKKHNSK